MVDLGGGVQVYLNADYLVSVRRSEDGTVHFQYPEPSRRHSSLAVATSDPHGVVSGHDRYVTPAQRSLDTSTDTL